MELLEELKLRGMINNISSAKKFSNLNKGVGVYIGFDPTAPSLHLGNYIQICVLKLFQKYGFKTYAVIGGATGMIGDPSGRSDGRNMLDKVQINSNKLKIKKQLKSFNFEIIDNLEFYQDLYVLDFLREVGPLLNINYMLSKESVKSRLENGMSFTEFSYQLLQGWDFKNLYEKYDVKVQIGGADQWGNITSGLEVIRKTIGDSNNAICLTTNLLEDLFGNKIGKSTGGGSLWIDKDMTNPFHMYQYILNFADADIKKMLLWFTDLSIEKIQKIMLLHNQEPFKRVAQKELAKNIIFDIHGKEWLESVKTVSEMLFGNISLQKLTKIDFILLEKLIPTFMFNENNICNILLKNKIVSSKRELNEFLVQGSLKINGHLIKKITENIEKADVIFDNYFLIQKGKKKYFLLKKK